MLMRQPRELWEQMAREVPDAYLANMSKKKHTGKIFIDFVRNDSLLRRLFQKDQIIIYEVMIAEFDQA
ncbi:MAG: hypothetical protein HRU78_14450 [Gammaproteobacteria bacterium]|nr:MAG: hypothetical protein HRU78_14450 [Gammaproteobacteria bacterium]